MSADYIEAHRPGWKNVKHAQQWTNTLTTYAAPVIGELSTNQITSEHILEILKPIWGSKAETASRVRNRIELVLDAAKARGLREDKKPPRWRGHLDKLLPPSSKGKRTQNHPALPYSELSRFIQALNSVEGQSAYALRMTILTACRPQDGQQGIGDRQRCFEAIASPLAGSTMTTHCCWSWPSGDHMPCDLKANR